MTRPELVVHGHFYQPPRIDPVSGTFPVDPTAAPARDWNARISAECYRPNAELGNLGAMSWNLGPTLAGWMDGGDPVAYRGFVDDDTGERGMAQPFHHPILPLAAAADRTTEVRWGLRDFELRFGRRPTGMWLPETAADGPTLRTLADEGVTHTILAPWQVEGDWIDTRRPVRLDLGDGRTMIAVLYDGLLSAAVSFEPDATTDADRFVAERLLPRFAQEPLPGEAPPLVVIATDGELYGHHQPGREHFLARLVGRTAPDDLSYDRPTLGEAVERAAAAGLPVARLRERTSWSCHHGVARWDHGCACVPDGTWKSPLRTAFDRLAGGVDAATEQLVRSLPGSPDPWAARDAYVDVLVGATDIEAFTAQRVGEGAATGAAAVARRTLATAMEAQRWRLAMFASCTWFWDVPDRIETAGSLRAAHRAATLIDGLTGTDLAARLVADLGGLDVDGASGAGLLDAALAAVADADRAGNPSARGLRATG